MTEPDVPARQQWRKRGLVIKPSGQPWEQTHGICPSVIQHDEQLWRVMYSPRDAGNRSHISSVLFDPQTGMIASRVEAPLLSPGPPGHFDADGAMNSWLTVHEGRWYLYYIGWTRGGTVPFHVQVGLAISEDGGKTFERVSPGPLFQRDAVDPIGTSLPFVMIDDGRWRMWYLAFVRWDWTGSEWKHYYHLRHAESSDGINWQRNGHVCIDFAGPHEYALARPYVLKIAGRYHMWFSHRGPTYRIGYAVSDDGLHWERNDTAAGIDVSPTGWDSEMIAYACVFRHRDQWYMLYNGNGYGREGIGLAELP